MFSGCSRRQSQSREKLDSAALISVSWVLQVSQMFWVSWPLLGSLIVPSAPERLYSLLTFLTASWCPDCPECPPIPTAVAHARSAVFGAAGCGDRVQPAGRGAGPGDSWGQGVEGPVTRRCCIWPGRDEEGLVPDILMSGSRRSLSLNSRSNGWKLHKWVVSW